MSRRTGGGTDETLSPDFLDFIACLNQRQVDAVLVGGYALGIHGIIRATADIDFLYRRTKETVHRLCAAMEDFGAPAHVIDAAALMTPEMVTQLGHPPHRIDLLSAIDGVSFEEVWRGAEKIEIEGHGVRVIGLDALRKNKAATGRPKDLEDLKMLRQARTRRKR